MRRNTGRAWIDENGAPSTLRAMFFLRFAALALLVPFSAPAQDAARLARGEKIFVEKCSLCHQIAGAGVPPVYPPLAVRAKVQGVVILEAVVDRQGRVEEVKVLRSIPLLDAAAIAAVRQWRYSPLLLNGQPERFVLTVTVSFRTNT